MKDTIQRLIRDSIDTKQKFLVSDQVAVLERIAQSIVSAYRAHKKVLVCGNGGSAADAQHLAAELVCRFQKNRAALPALALTTDTSILTAIGNDYGFDNAFSRQVEAHAAAGDVVIGITTSGKSPNIVKAFDAARAKKAVTIAFTGSFTDALKDKSDICLSVPSNTTARVQECHILSIHILCALVEDTLFGQN